MPRPKKLPVPPPPSKAHERAWGEGSVEEVRPGVWRAWRTRTTHPDTGKPYRPSETFKGDRAEQRAKLWARGDVEPAVLLLGMWLDRWLDLRRPTIDEGTYEIYRRAVEVCAPLGARPLAAIDEHEWQALTNSLLLVWSREHVKVWRTIIKGAVQAAIPRHLAANPLRLVRLPKREEAPPKAWTQAEVDRLVAWSAGHHHQAWLVFSIGTGVRLGEARALLWVDVDLVHKTATIRASLNNHSNKRGPTKTRRVRVVDIPDEVIPFLTEKARSQPPGTAHVFGSKGDLVPGTNAYRSWLRRLCKNAASAPLAPHSTRHTYASLALDDGVPIQDIAHQLGHSVKTCQDTYAHFIGQGQRRAANALGRALSRRREGRIRLIGTGNGTREPADQEGGYRTTTTGTVSPSKE